MAYLLLVEDDELLRDGLCAQLVHAGHSVEAAGDGAQAQALLESTRLDGVVLDLGLPPVQGMAMDGIVVLRWIRQRLPHLPVLILTARDDIDDRVAGLNAGADDYLTKPFDMAELLARLAAMLRRSRMPAFDGSLQTDAPPAHRMRLDPQLPIGWLGEDVMELTHREWSLLGLLLKKLGQVVGREEVLAVWQTQAPEGVAGGAGAGAGTGGGGASGAGPGSNALEVYVHRLRRKLQGSGLNIRNVRGLGYLLELQAP
jgi:DNA-binding response OmpR family regulator